MYVIDCIKDKKIDLNFYNRHCLRFYVYIILSLFIHCLFFNYNCENFLNEVITPAQDTNAQNVTTIHTETYSNKDNNADELGSIKNNSNIKNSTNNKTLVLCENNIAAIGQVQIGNYIFHKR